MRVRTQERREAIVEAAAKLFEEMGYEAASMNELAKRLGGSKATLYGYFASKEALLVAVVETFATAHLADATAELLQKLEKRPALKPTLLHFGERALQVLTNDQSALGVNRMVLAAAGRSNVGQLFRDAGPTQCIEALAKLMAHGMERGDLRKLDPHVGAQQFLSLLTAEVNARMYLPSPPFLETAQIRQMVVRAVDAFLLGAAKR